MNYVSSHHVRSYDIWFPYRAQTLVFCCGLDQNNVMWVVLNWASAQDADGCDHMVFDAWGPISIFFLWETQLTNVQNRVSLCVSFVCIFVVCLLCGTSWWAKVGSQVLPVQSSWIYFTLDHSLLFSKFLSFSQFSGSFVRRCRTLDRLWGKFVTFKYIKKIDFTGKASYEKLKNDAVLPVFLIINLLIQSGMIYILEVNMKLCKTIQEWIHGCLNTVMSQTSSDIRKWLSSYRK